MDPTKPAAPLPTGTVTFLLTDVAGSTRLWEADREAMAKAIARHYEIIDECVAKFAGARPVEQGEGDSTVSAFARASDAVRAALDIQREMVDEPWPVGATIKVRIGVHTGEAQLRDDGNYFGDALNRCARLRSIGHGGQTLLSRTTMDLIADDLPDDAALADLGEHRLRDLARPEHIYELRHSDLPSGFPPLASTGAARSTLPRQMTSFIGREAEIAEVCGLVAENRNVTLTGSGGCGKTRLALQVAGNLVETFGDGVYWVDLSSLVEHSLVPSAIASALALPEEVTQSIVRTITAWLAGRRVLLVLDNCEHLAAACASLADRLLGECDRLTILATSREPLGAQGETAWNVPSLSLPSDEEGIEALTRSEAVRLFLDRARKGRPNFRLTASNAAAISTICRRLDGIPLAIELAAGRTRTLTPQQIAEGLSDRFRLLTGGLRTALPRQRTLESSVEWSYALLDEDEKSLFRRLSVFAGGFTLEAAERVCSGGGLDEIAILDLLSQLIDRSLVQVDETRDESRYRLLETIRDYARRKLSEAGEIAAVRDRHVDYYLELAERIEPEIEAAQVTEWAHVTEWADRLELDHDNLRAAMEWSVEAQQSDRALRLPAALLGFWFARHLKQGRTRLETAIAMNGGTDSARAKALTAAANLAGVGLMDPLGARTLAEQALSLARQLEDDRLIGRALTALSWPAVAGDPAAARAVCEEAVAVTSRNRDLWFLCLALPLQGYFELQAGNRPASEAAFRRAYDVITSRGLLPAQLPFMVQVPFWLGFSALLWGEFDAAERYLDEASAMAHEIGSKVFVAFSLATRGGVALGKGDRDLARAKLDQASELAQRARFWPGIALTDSFRSRLEYAEGNLDDAMIRGEEALTLARAIGVRWLMPNALLDLARVTLAKGDYAAAHAQADEALSMARESEIPILEGNALQALAQLARAEGDMAQAEDLNHEALEIFAGRGLTLDIIDTIEAIAGLAATNESFEEAARLFGAADAARDAVGFPRYPIDQPRYVAQVDLVRTALGEAFDGAWKEGSALTLDEAVAYATRARGERKRPSHGWASLTPTELDVVRLVREGLTNPQIGERLFISKGTVRTHLTHVFAKLGVATRAELAAQATRRELR